MKQVIDMGKPNILIVEDEQKLSRVLQLELEYENYATDIADNGKDALNKLENNRWDLVLLDIMLPELSGMEVLRRFRRSNRTTPIILLTARDQVHDKVSGLDLGANDYMTKPFQIEELLARIRVHLRLQTTAEMDSRQLAIGELVVDTGTREVKRNDHQIELTPREFDLLIYLLKNKNQVLTRDQLIEHVWGFDYYGDTNVVDVYIRYLRQKIDKDFDSQYIQTVRGVGYTIKETAQ
ncbi:two-component system response regulator YkoG [Virgibacillus siamensis]|uniref:Two-component system response regulator YkoG n=2 Tax=Virgibacillus siamensis TaxID=480071 RepID=A0ABN1GFN5_9BACI